jgi:hypothetical protein
MRVRSPENFLGEFFRQADLVSNHFDCHPRPRQRLGSLSQQHWPLGRAKLDWLHPTPTFHRHVLHRLDVLGVANTFQVACSQQKRGDRHAPTTLQIGKTLPINIVGQLIQEIVSGRQEGSGKPVRLLLNARVFVLVVLNVHHEMTEFVGSIEPRAVGSVLVAPQHDDRPRLPADRERINARSLKGQARDDDPVAFKVLDHIRYRPSRDLPSGLSGDT